MAEQLGLKGILEFENKQALQAMAQTSKSFSKIRDNAKQVKKGMSNLRQGFAGFNIVTAAMGAGVVSSIKKFGDFEGQMAAVKAVLGNDAKPAFEALETTAMKLGATTSFTSQQAAEAMENLARSGMSANQVMASIGPTLNAAAADGLDLATAADIVASNMKAFGLQAKDATLIADQLAFVSSKTNTNMAGLQEGLKFVGPVAKQMGIGLGDAAASLGALADIGLKGTLAGTGLKNALLKIASSAKNGKVEVGKFKAEVAKTESGQVNLAGTMTNIVAKLQSIEDPLERAQASMDLLGMRGMGAAAAFEALGRKEGGVAGLFNGVNQGAAGTAKRMKEMRLGGFHGDMVRLSSAVDGFRVSLGKMVAPKIAGGIKKLSKFLGSKEVAQGLTEGLGEAAKIFKGFFSVFKAVGRGLNRLFHPFSRGGATTQGMISFTAKIAALGIGLKLTTSLFTRMAQVGVGSFRILQGSVGVLQKSLGGMKGILGLSGALPKGVGRLAGAVKGLDQISAQPVRVVNFHEAGGLGMGTGTGTGGTPVIGGKTKGKTPTKAPTRGAKVGGALMKVGTVTIVGAAAYHFGTALDEALGLSDMWSDAAVYQEKMARRWRLDADAQKIASERATKQAEMFARLSRQGKQVTEVGGFKRHITKKLVEEKLRKGELKGASESQIADVLRKLEPILNALPTKKEAEAGKHTKVSVFLDSRVVGQAVAGVNRDNKVRKGTKVNPGDKLFSKAL